MVSTAFPRPVHKANSPEDLHVQRPDLSLPHSSQCGLLRPPFEFQSLLHPLTGSEFHRKLQPGKLGTLFSELLLNNPSSLGSIGIFFFFFYYNCILLHISMLGL